MTPRTPDRFIPTGAPSRETLRAYVEGRLDPRAAHEVERHLEADPLLRDAVEGLQQPGALAGLKGLHEHAPKTNGARWSLWITALLVVCAGAWYLTGKLDTRVDPTPVRTEEATTTGVATIVETSVPEASELAAAVELPESLHIGHARADRHSLAQATPIPVPQNAVDSLIAEPVLPRNTTIDRLVSTGGASIERHHRPSLQLVYLHDLKLLHPKEMYDRSPEIERLTRGVDARYSGANDQRDARGEERRMHYLAFMDEALEKFVRNDHRGCLEELRFVLDQYKNDVNALFYAGLCCYNLGLYERATRFLDRARNDSSGVFDEEADWYHALALMRNGQKEEARIEMERIAGTGSFYADRAKEALEKRAIADRSLE